ncbi:unnamed protein product [Darwinula stevensoni]|uniref:Endothelin-converting enzyme 1 n=1 Tax=Darwinula stevensoni TaxID=69355 RepID=A0A7R9A607_9CRUS|nr:unnamed protein product [Darwinula stevensoni]CAG0887730.1 unnamed protein product [Darwinula stevensoni]
MNESPQYKQADFEEETSSVGSVTLGINDGITFQPQHFRFYTGCPRLRMRTALERILCSCCIASAFLIFVLTILLMIHYFSTPEIHKEAEACLTPSCIQTSASILAAMDLTIDPCEDFYHYACGGWVRKNPLPAGKSMWNIIEKLSQENQLVLRNALDDLLKQENNLKGSSAEMLALRYFISCVDKDGKLEDLGATPLVEFIEELGGWNISSKNFQASTWNFQKAVQKIHNKFNLGGLFRWKIGDDDRNATQYIIQIDQGGLSLPSRDYYLNKSIEVDDVLSALLEYMTRTGLLLQGPMQEEPLEALRLSLKDQMRAVIEFEILLANITTPSDQRRDEEKLYHKMPLRSLQGLAPFLDWKAYMNEAFGLVNKSITEDESVLVYAPEYLSGLSKLVEVRLTTEKGKIQLGNYVMWHAVNGMVSTLSRSFRDALRDLKKALVGGEGETIRWRDCIDDTTNTFGYSMGGLFVKTHFNGSAKAQAQQMISEIKAAFQENLVNLPWMDDETLHAAIIKANAITDMIGYPEFIMNTEELNKKYDGLNIRSDAYFENNILMNQQALRENLDNLGKPVNRTKWEMSPPTVNAYYTPTRNQMVFPAGIMQPPFYSPDFPQALNYGGLGIVMGHELTHAFDDQGREYDKDGNLNAWWNNATIKRFTKQTQCFVHQYAKFKINEENLNGVQTLGENLADNGGLKAAYKAYDAWLFHQSNFEDQHLPGLNFTFRQLFFISFAQVWCSVGTKEAFHLQVVNDDHSPGEFRVIGALSNNDDFSREFNCPRGSRMNPSEKCVVW